MPHHHPIESTRKIGKVVRKTKCGHHLRRRRNVESIFARIAIRRAAQSDDRLTQSAVVHVESTSPNDAPLIERESIAPVGMVVDHRRQQIVRRDDRVKVAGEMNVDRIARRNLSEAAAGRAALHAEERPERRLSHTDYAFLADAVERIGKPNCRGRLALARWRGTNGGYQNELAVRPSFKPGQEIGLDLRHVAPVCKESGLRDADFRGDVVNGPQANGARNLEVGGHEGRQVFAKRQKNEASNLSRRERQPSIDEWAHVNSLDARLGGVASTVRRTSKTPHHSAGYFALKPFQRMRDRLNVPHFAAMAAGDDNRGSHP